MKFGCESSYQMAVVTAVSQIVNATHISLKETTMQRETILACTESLEAKCSEVIPIIDSPHRSDGRGILLLSMMGGTALFVLGLFCLSFFTVKAQSRPVQTAAPTGPIIIFPIGLPDAQTVYVQTITQTAQITLTWRAFFSTTTQGGTIPEPLPILTETIPAESLRVYTAPINFEGSAIIESDAPIHVANLMLSETGNDAYVGFKGRPVTTDDTSRHQNGIRPQTQAEASFVHQILVDRFTTGFCVQNLANTDMVVQVIYRETNGNQTTPENVTIPPQGSDCFIPRVSGQAIVMSDKPFDVATLEIQDDIQGLRANHAVIPSGGYTNTVFVPALFKQKEQQSSRLCIQSASHLTNTIEVAYTDGLTTSLTTSSLGEGTCFDQAEETHIIGWEGAATISATHAVAVAVIVLARDAANVTRGVWAYAPPTQILADQRGVALPALFNGKDEWHSTVYLYNPSPQSATVTPRLIDRSGAILCTESLTIPANTVTTFALNPEEHAFTEGMGYFHSTTPLAATVRGASAKAVDDITDRFYGYEAAYFDVRSLPSHPPTPCTSEGLVYDEYYAEQEREYASIGAPAMWQRGLTGIAPGRAITVAVIDTGVANHPDLVDNLISGYNFVAGEP
ncbi:MAG: hypothetical protein KDE53_22375, partial [Caldilineaceae bacterium]|nr:hypothetical protein [Caldilineaceae bacterium]